MKETNNISKIVVDQTALKLIWAAWSVPIILIVYVCLRWFIGDQEFLQYGFFPFIYKPGKIYMLILGIISASAILPYYVKVGVTRKDYFYGEALSTVVFSFLLILIGMGIAGLEHLFITPIDGAVLMIHESWFVSYFVYSLNVIVYFLVGWFIGAGFYRFGVLIGLLNIVISIMVVSILDSLWEFELKGILGKFSIPSVYQDFSIVVSFIGTFLLIGLGLWAVRQTLKRVAIKK